MARTPIPPRADGGSYTVPAGKYAIVKYAISAANTDFSLITVNGGDAVRTTANSGSNGNVSTGLTGTLVLRAGDVVALLPSGNTASAVLTGFEYDI